jgi:transposase InsO family protein
VQKKVVIETLVRTGRCSMARACRLFGLARSAAYRNPVREAGRLALEGLVAETSRRHPCLGYRKVTAILRSAHGETVNPKRVARLRRRDGLLATRRGAKRRRIQPRERVRRSATRRDEVWSYDFIQDSLADGRTVRILSIIDEYSRECVMLRSARSFPARRVIDCLEELLVTTGRKPEWLRSDNGPEFVASRVQDWLKQAGVGSACIKPGSPWENGHVESFHASLRAEFLDRELFFSMKEVAVLMEDWRHHYNHERPHGSLSNQPPVHKSGIAKSTSTTKNNLQNSH